ncbi:putative G-protein coupled receptor 83 [Holothuria leucospilota]|uniref:G-protein coupled receptor 83 n=1 Tax=Holothuria leucospilota TaxID=206669 RepID=A0A9Q1BGR2_HOLLE|nr:putative G-protein coupled receptor 83 [Holothuria leucospilota]
MTKGDAPSLFDVLKEHLSKTNTTLRPVSTLNEIFNHERPATTYDFPSPYSSECRVLFTILYTLLTIISLCGNSTVCYVVLRNKRMRTVTNFFLANQAMSDVIMTFFNIPFIVTKEMTRSWPFGLVACHFVDFIGVLSVYVSTFTLTAIAVDRHRVIVHPLKPRITMATAILITVFIWALSVTLSLPYLIWKDLIGLSEVDPTLVVCFSTFPKPTELYKHLLTYTTLLLQYVIPLVIISTSYVSIGHKLWSRTAVGDVIESQQAANARMKIRTTRMLVAVVAVFSICWLPIHVYLLVTFYHNSWKHDFVYLCFHWFAMLSVCISPIAFCLLNENFRNDIKIAIGRLTTKLFRKTPDKVTRANMEDGVGGTKSQDTFANTMSKEIHTLSEDIALTKSTTAGKYTTTPTTQVTGKIIKLVVPIATIDVSEA